MTLQKLIDADTRHVTVATTIVLFVLLVLMAVFLYIVRLSRGEASGFAGPTPTATEDWRSTDGSPTHETSDDNATPGSTGSALGAVPLPTHPNLGADFTLYEDPTHGFRLQMLDSWREVEVLPADTSPSAAEYHHVFEDPRSGARLGISIWETSSPSEWDKWADEWLPGLQPIGGAWAPTALIAGEPAVVAWAPGSPTAPPQYAVVFDHDGLRYRLAYGAADGGQLMEEYVRAIVTFDFDRADPQSDVPPDQLPPLPQPMPQFFGGEAPITP